MSVAGISSSGVMYMNGSSQTAGKTSTRQAEDAAARELVTDLQKGDLAGASQAYSTLASFGANNSGPWAQGSQMQQQFQQLGQDLASGNLAGARTDTKGLAADQLQHDMQAISQSSGSTASYNQAVQNYQGDYYAIFGQMPNTNPSLSGGSPSAAPGFNVTA